MPLLPPIGGGAASPSKSPARPPHGSTSLRPLASFERILPTDHQQQHAKSSERETPSPVRIEAATTGPNPPGMIENEDAGRGEANMGSMFGPRKTMTITGDDDDDEEGIGDLSWSAKIKSCFCCSSS